MVTRARSWQFQEYVTNWTSRTSMLTSIPAGVQRKRAGHPHQHLLYVAPFDYPVASLTLYSSCALGVYPITDPVYVLLICSFAQ